MVMLKSCNLWQLYLCFKIHKSSFTKIILINKTYKNHKSLLAAEVFSAIIQKQNPIVFSPSEPGWYKLGLAYKIYHSVILHQKSSNNTLQNISIWKICIYWFSCLNTLKLLVNMLQMSQDGAEDGSRVASSGKTLQFFVCFICFFVVLRVRCC